MAEDGDESMVGVLFQFIPFYGQGDPSNDSTVRAALSSLSIEDIDSKDEYGNTLLLLACTYRCEDLVRIMLNKGADPNAVNSAGACSLHFACYGESASLVIAKGLLQNGANPEVVETTYGCTPLHYCASNGSIEFCKLLLSHGAQIGTVDYYNYTCVDYAQQAGMAEAAVYLQKKLDQHQMQYQYRSAGFGLGGSPMHGMMRQQSANMYSGSMGEYYSMNQGMSGSKSSQLDWSPIMDPSSGCMYYVHNSTGETLWEHDWKQRVGFVDQQSHTGIGSVSISSSSSAPILPSDTSATPAAETKKKKKATIDVKQKTDAWLNVQTTKTRLIAFLAKHVPARLPEVDTLMAQYKGREADVMKDLCAQYGIAEDAELAAFEAKLVANAANPPVSNDAADGESSGTSASSYVLGAMKSMFGGSSTAKPTPNIAVQSGRPVSAARRPGSATPAGNIPRGIDSLTLQSMINEERSKLESKLIEDRNAFRISISEKDGVLSKLNTELATLHREEDNMKV